MSLECAEWRLLCDALSSSSRLDNSELDVYAEQRGGEGGSNCNLEKGDNTITQFCTQIDLDEFQVALMIAHRFVPRARCILW